jgi:hypothetical protein
VLAPLVARIRFWLTFGLGASLGFARAQVTSLLLPTGSILYGILRRPRSSRKPLDHLEGGVLGFEGKQGMKAPRQEIAVAAGGNRLHQPCSMSGAPEAVLPFPGLQEKIEC